jgi:phosphatidate phosphatase APP1
MVFFFVLIKKTPTAFCESKKSKRFKSKTPPLNNFNSNHQTKTEHRNIFADVPTVSVRCTSTNTMTILFATNGDSATHLANVPFQIKKVHRTVSVCSKRIANNL